MSPLPAGVAGMVPIGALTAVTGVALAIGLAVLGRLRVIRRRRSVPLDTRVSHHTQGAIEVSRQPSTILAIDLPPLQSDPALARETLSPHLDDAGGATQPVTPVGDHVLTPTSDSNEEVLHETPTMAADLIDEGQKNLVKADWEPASEEPSSSPEVVGDPPEPSVASSPLAATPAAGLDETPNELDSGKEGTDNQPQLEIRSSEATDGADNPETLPPAPRAARQYRPSSRLPGAGRGRGPATQLDGQAVRSRAFPIEVRVLREHGGFCRVSLVARRDETLPDRLAVSGSGNPEELVRLQSDWFEDVSVPDLGDLLRTGVEWQSVTNDGVAIRWSLSGRPLYVLGRHEDLGGFVSMPALVLGEEHLVLCTPERTEDVLLLLESTGTPRPTRLDVPDGIPAGWVGLGGVVPARSVPRSLEGDIYDALRPRGDLQIVLDGGIRLARQTWLLNHPPRIRLRGTESPDAIVMIDGGKAVRDTNGYSAPGWDALGDHEVWCSGLFRTYSIQQGIETWQSWPAHSYKRRSPSRVQQICGPLISSNDSVFGAPTVTTKASNPLLLGASPHEVVIFEGRGDLWSGVRTGTVQFTPIWAIPLDPAHADRSTIRIELLAGGLPLDVLEPRDMKRVLGTGREVRRRLGLWISAILAANQKRLSVSPDDRVTRDLWRRYVDRAKNIRRRLS